LRARRFVIGLLLFATVAIGPAIVRADDRFRLDVRGGRDAERFQSHEADSLGLSFTTSTFGSADFSFRVMDLPLKKPWSPSLVVFGHTSTADRVFVPASAGGTTMPRRSPMIEMLGGIGLAVPLGIVDGTRGADFLVRYEGGVFIAADSGENFLQTSSLHFGFARDGGVFDGSEIEVGNGHDDLFGSAWAAKRWSARVLLMMGVGRPIHAIAAGDSVATVARWPLRAFLESSLQTDGRPGPDRIAVRLGAALDLGALLERIGGGNGNAAAPATKKEEAAGS